MVNVNEVRLGNWLERDGKYFQVSLIDEAGFIGETIITANPIPLTEEILLKAGFVKEQLEDGNPGEGYFYSLRLSNDKYCDLALLSGDKNGYCEVTLFPYTEIFRYRHVHQLQNIYQAITGTELTINL